MQMPNWMPEPGSPIDRIATFVMANLIWFVLALMIVPLPAATAGLFATLAPWVRGKDTELFGTFFGTMRQHWLKSTVIGVIDVVIAVIVYMNFQAISLMALENSTLSMIFTSVTLFIALSAILINLYIWPLLVLFDLPYRRLFYVAASLALAHPFWSLLIVAMVLLLLSLVLFLPTIIIVFGLFSAIALVINWGTWRIIRKYATSEELAELNQPSNLR